MMSRTLFEAAAKGDVAWIDHLCSTIDNNSGTSSSSASSASAELERYLLSRKSGNNIMQIAVNNGQQVFISHVLEKVDLSPALKIELICQQSNKFSNPLHRAASTGHLEIVKILMKSYRKFSKLAIDDDDEQPPWAVTAHTRGGTPLHMALRGGHEEVAAYILSQDMETLSNILDYDGKSPLYLAIEKGCEGIALQILTSDCSYKLEPLPTDNSTILHNASRITEQVGVLLLEKHPEVLRERTTRGETFLHSLARQGKLKSVACLVKGKVFSIWSAVYRELLSQKDNSGNNPIHDAISSSSGKVEVIKLLIEAYFEAEPSNYELDELPWLHVNSSDETPLEMAILQGQDKIAEYLLSLDSVRDSLSNDNDNDNGNGNGNNPLFLALECRRDSVVKFFLKRVPCDSSTRLRGGPRGQNPFHAVSKCPGSGFARDLVDYLGTKLLHVEDESGKTPLDYAAEAGNIDVVEVVLEHSGCAPYAWVKACEGHKLGVLPTFMKYCDFKEVHLKQRDTPLHHIHITCEVFDKERYENIYKNKCEEILAIPVISQLKNALDKDGATPLHRAIERKDIIFVELLLSVVGIDLNIKNKQGQTALDLLAKLCDESPDWEAMCNRINMNPRIKTTYIPLKANLVKIRQTLSVVAALLATITFAAGFTIPGGYNDDGYVILARRAAFIVFLLSDTYAMCCSILVLFCLIWAMVSDRDKSSILVDRSVVILQQALYGMLVAFMTGVYTVVYHDCLWTAIVVCVLCSIVAVAANRRVLYNLLCRIPSTRL